MALLTRFRIHSFVCNTNSLRIAPSVVSGFPIRHQGNGVGKIDENDEQLKQSILEAALKHVNSKGWTRNAIKAGAEELNISGEVSNMFSEYEIVRYFIEKSNDDLESHLRENKLNLHDALQWRLQKTVPYVPRFNEALAYTTQPQNAKESVQLLQSLADIIAHYALQDKSSDLSWYAKRVGIASIYVASELHLLQDNSENFQETWKFLSRRVEDFGKVVEQGSVLPFANALPEVLNIGFTTVMNMLGKNRPR